jgi:putative flippase GtrA
MIPIEHLKAKYPRVAALIGPHIDTLRKAISFALIGVVNVMIDGGVFLIAYAYLNSSEAALRRLDAVATACGCATREKVLLISANLTSWVVAVSCSYVMNSHITFAAESGRQLRLRSYLTFLASAVFALVANTTALLFAVDVLLLPVVVGKVLAIGVSFVVNFSLARFVVFRPQQPQAGEAV